ncbi:unnamed protein product [Arctia plantaginis]|uniref:MADF domain-containing protein n=1 Tax=Arctia plantaginis TaxID=874455 RepID=A0A8S1ASF8_ARCPL|nr:unnamed protein product [Arctia plantaginis]
MERLIETVRKYPCLWKLDSEEYKLNDFKEAAWIEVAKEWNLLLLRQVTFSESESLNANNDKKPYEENSNRSEGNTYTQYIERLVAISSLAVTAATANYPAVVGELLKLLVEDRRSEGIDTLEGAVELTTQKAVFERNTEASTSATSSQKPNKPDVVGERSELLEEDGNCEGIDTLDSQDESISDYKDMRTWPISIPDNLRTLLVTRGYKAVQNHDYKFAGVIRPGPVDSTKGPKGVT